MKQYIDRNALLEELRNDLNNDINIYHSHTAKEIRDEKYEFAIERVEEASAADVRENIHAKWIQLTTYDDDDGNAVFKCSNCRAIDEHFKGAKIPYCWYCGAVMDLE